MQYYKRVSLDELLLEAQQLFDGCSKEANPKYLRGMSELIAGVFGSVDIPTEESVSLVSDHITFKEVTNNL